MDVSAPTAALAAVFVIPDTGRRKDGETGRKYWLLVVVVLFVNLGKQRQDGLLPATLSGPGSIVIDVVIAVKFAPGVAEHRQ